VGRKGSGGLYSAMVAESEERQGLILVLVSTLAYGTLPVIGKAAYAAGVRPEPLLAWRFVIAAALFALLSRGKGPSISLRQRFVLWGLGVVFVVNALAYFTALETVPAATVALLIYTYPVIVTLLSGFAGLDPLTPRGLGGAGLAVAGCALTATGEIAGGSGVLYALASAFIYATYVVLSSHFATGVPSLTAALHLAQASAVVCIGWALGRGGLAVPPSFPAWAAIVGLAVISTVVALRAFLAGLARVGPARASVLSSLEVVVTMGLAVLVLGERLGPRQWAGALLILAAVAFQNLATLRRLRIPGRRASG
jgi:drug/metabolite transporter (DMT)-like permease